MFLGIDLGTSEVKVLLLDEQRRVGRPPQARRWRCSARSRCGPSRTRPTGGRPPRTPCAQLRAAPARALARGARHRPVGPDARRGAARRATTTCCARPSCGTTAAATPQCAELTRARADAARGRRQPGDAGLHRAQAAVGAPSTSRRCSPRIAQRAAAQGLPAPAPDRRDASATPPMRPARCGSTWRARDWSDELLAACGLRRAQMPRAGRRQRRSRACCGPSWRAPGACGAGVVVAGGAGDNAASAVGVGAVQPGRRLHLAGHLGRALRGQRPLPPEPGVGGACVLPCACPARWHQMSVMLSAASCLRWFSRMQRRCRRGRAARGGRAALTPTQRAAAPIFLPYLAGERTPHNDPLRQRRASSACATRRRAPACAYAVLEGVAFGLADGLDALRSTGTR